MKKSPETDRATYLAEGTQTNLNLVRKVSRTLFPVRIAENGLEAALDELTSYFTKTTDIKFDVQMDGCHRHLTDQTILHLYRIAYEGIFNAMHHSIPCHIRISLSGSMDHCSLLIENDGSDAAKPVNNNMEVQLMHYRARQINGQLAVNTTSDNHTIITCKIPYDLTYKRESKESASYA